MKNSLTEQIVELRKVHKGLTKSRKVDNVTIICGSLPFEASSDEYAPITDCFNVELIIPNNYPVELPTVRETKGKIDKQYEHRYNDGTLCLAVPIEERRIFFQQPTLLGFVNNLLIPYLFGYCYWQQHRIHPFGESAHGHKGIIQFYFDLLGVTNEITVLAVVSFIYEFGYRGHHLCPCGSGEIVRRCHGKTLLLLKKLHTDYTKFHDFLVVLDVCKSKSAFEQIPKPIIRQVLRILTKSNFSRIN